MMDFSLSFLLLVYDTLPFSDWRRNKISKGAFHQQVHRGPTWTFLTLSEGTFRVSLKMYRVWTKKVPFH